MKIYVSNHAMERLRERFLFTFPSSMWRDKRSVESLIIAQVSKARECIKWKQSPFYYNMLTSKYTKDITIFERSGIYFCCRIVGDKCFVMTVVPHIPCENKD